MEIPNLQESSVSADGAIGANKICGSVFNAAPTATVHQTICSWTTPFRSEFSSLLIGRAQSRLCSDWSTLLCHKELALGIKKVHFCLKLVLYGIGIAGLSNSSDLSSISSGENCFQSRSSLRRGRDDGSQH